jgi:hypothetical protein
MRELLTAGSLTPVIRVGEGLAGTWLLSKTQLEAIAKDCSTHALPRHVIRDDAVVSLRTVLKTWRLSPGEFPALLQAAQLGEIRCSARETDDFRVGSLSLDRMSLRHWHMEWRSQNNLYVSVDAAARLLGIKQQVAYHLVKRKALGSEILNQNSNIRRIPSAAIDNFRRTYVSLAQLARARGSSPKAVLDSLIVRPVIGPTIDGCRQYFFLRADLEK